MSASGMRAPFVPNPGPRWEPRRAVENARAGRYDRDLRPKNVSLRRPFLFALALHFLGAVPFVFAFRAHVSLPLATRATSVQLVALSAPRHARVTREPPAVVKPPVPATKVRVKPLPRADLTRANPKVVKDEPSKAAKPQKNEPKIGSADTVQVVHSDLPAVGNMRGTLSLWAEGAALPYSYYFEVLQQKITSDWSPPVDLMRAGGEVTTVVWLRIEADGRVSSRYVEEPSGSNVFDTAALRALDTAAPFPPLPAEYAGDHLIIHLRLVYSP